MEIWALAAVVLVCASGSWLQVWREKRRYGMVLAWRGKVVGWSFLAFLVTVGASNALGGMILRSAVSVWFVWLGWLEPATFEWFAGEAWIFDSGLGSR